MESCNPLFENYLQRYPAGLGQPRVEPRTPSPVARQLLGHEPTFPLVPSRFSRP